MDLERLNKVAEGLVDFIVSSDGVEIYRISSQVSLQFPRALERIFSKAFSPAQAIREINIDIWLSLIKKFMGKYTWIEGLNGVDEKYIELRTDYPVLDISNKIVPDPDEAAKRLKDLEEIQEFANRAFREARKNFEEKEYEKIPGWWRVR